MEQLPQILALIALALATPALAFAWIFAIPGAGSPGISGYLVLMGIPLLWLAMMPGVFYWFGGPTLVAELIGALVLLLLAVPALHRIRRGRSRVAEPKIIPLPPLPDVALRAAPSAPDRSDRPVP